MMKRICEFDKRPRDYNLIVVGGSPPGLACAKKAASLGANVAVIANLSNTEEVLQQEMFLEMLYHAGKHRTLLKEAQNYSWKFGLHLLKPVLLQKLQELKKVTREKCKKRLECFLDKKKIDYYVNCKLILGYPITVAVSDYPEDFFTSTYMVLAPIGTYEYPDIYGAKLGLLPKDLMEMEQIDGNILIAGGGSDALELASSFIQMGQNTTLISRSGVTSCFDDQMMTLYVKTLMENGLKLFLKTIIKCLKKTEDNKIQVEYITLSKSWKGCQIFDYVIFVEKPFVNLKRLKLQKINLKTIFNTIPTNKELETNIRNVFAIGPALQYSTFNRGVDIQMGKNLARHLFLSKKIEILEINDKTGVIRGPIVDYSFTGLTENAATLLYGADNLEVYHGYYKPTEYGIAKKPHDYCYLKIICLRTKDELVIGMHILGPYAATIMQGYTAAMRSGVTYSRLANLAGIFPTVAREFTLVKITKRSGVEPKLQSCCS